LTRPVVWADHPRCASGGSGGVAQHRCGDGCSGGRGAWDRITDIPSTG
jgi:hypothetical protein